MEEIMSDHERYMLRAIELAGKVPDAPFGAMIVDRDNGKILSEGWNKTSVNPTWHGEIDAVNALASTRQSTPSAYERLLPASVPIGYELRGDMGFSANQRQDDGPEIV